MKGQKVNSIADEAGFRIIFWLKPKGLPKMQLYQVYWLSRTVCHRPSCAFPVPTGRNCPGALPDGEDFHSLAGQLQREWAKDAAICTKGPLPLCLPSQEDHSWTDVKFLLSHRLDKPVFFPWVEEMVQKSQKFSALLLKVYPWANMVNLEASWK